MNGSANTDIELRSWPRWASEGGNTPMFVRTVAEAALIACLPDYALLRPVLLELKRQHPQPPSGPAAPDDPELARWLQWATRGGNVLSFVSGVAEAAAYACANDYALLRPVLIELKRRYPENLHITVAETFGSCGNAGRGGSMAPTYPCSLNGVSSINWGPENRAAIASRAGESTSGFAGQGPLARVPGARFERWQPSFHRTFERRVRDKAT